MDERALLLEHWANFYAVTSTSAATLLGLLFVVITLAAERRLKEAVKIRVYLTPIVFYFSSVLFTGAFMALPGLTPLTTVLCICLEGVAGLGYAGSLAVRRGAKGFYDSRSDLFPYVIFPFVSYAFITAGGFFSLHSPQFGFNLPAAGVLFLLALGIRNSWSIAVSIVSSHA